MMKETKKIRKSLARRIRQSRQAANMLQADLAGACRISRTAVSNIENGKQSLNVELFYTIAMSLGENPGDLLNDVVGSAHRDKETIYGSVDPKKIEFIKLTVGGSKNEQED